MSRKKKMEQITTILGKGTDFQGDFTAEGSVRVDGNVNGNIKLTGTLIVGAAGIITGNVEAESAVIGGEVLGNVTVADELELTSTARVLGDVSTKLIVIDESAVFQGRCDMNQDTPDHRKHRAAASKAIRTGRKSAKAAIQEALKEMAEEEKREDAVSASTDKFPEVGSSQSSPAADASAITEEAKSE